MLITTYSYRARNSENSEYCSLFVPRRNYKTHVFPAEISIGADKGNTLKACPTNSLKASPSLPLEKVKTTRAKEFFALILISPSTVSPPSPGRLFALMEVSQPLLLLLLQS